MYKTKKKKYTCLFKICLMLVVIIAATVHFTEISLADSESACWVVTAVSSDGQNIDSKAIGFTVNWKGTTYIVCTPLGEGTNYVFTYGDDYVEMKQCDNPTGIDDEMNWFVPSDINYVPTSVTQGSLNVQYELSYFNSDGELETNTITFSEIKKAGNVYVTGLSGMPEDVWFPMIIKDGNGGLIGYIPSTSGAVLLEEPIGSEETAGSEATENSRETVGSDETSDSGKQTGYNPLIIGMICGALGGAFGGYRSYKKKKKKIVDDQSQTPEQRTGSDSTPGPTTFSEDIPIPGPTTFSEDIPIPGPVPTPVPQPGGNHNKEWFIEIEGGVMNGFIYPVKNGILIGRGAESDVQYPRDTDGISRKHCKIFVNNNQLFVMDLQSTSGTFVKGVGQLLPNVPQNLQPEDVIYLAEKKNAIVIRCRSLENK